MNALNDLFLDELADILYAEKLLVKALPAMAKAAQNEKLKKAFVAHLAETQKQVERVKQVFEAFGKPAKSKKCDAMEGLLEEGKKILAEWKGSPALDAALISAAQKVEHYEIASYGCLCTWAKMLNKPKALQLLKQTINEEEQADKKLSDLAEDCINAEAEA
jgi:ferritin-like metal-binding protein YciE